MCGHRYTPALGRRITEIEVMRATTTLSVLTFLVLGFSADAQELTSGPEGPAKPRSASMSFAAISADRVFHSQATVQPISYSIPEGSPGRSGLFIPIHSWVFVGCVFSQQHCHQHAHEHGFYQFTMRHDHRTCPAPPGLACYGLSP